MDHPLPAPDALVRPWRTAAFVAGAVAAIELLLLLLIGGGKLVAIASDRLQLAAKERAVPTQAKVAPTRRNLRRTPAPVPRRPRSKTSVIVLNGNGRTGAAGAAAARVRARGYRIGAVGNAPKPAARTLVMFRPGFGGEGRRLARDLGIGLVGPLDGMRASALGRAQLVVILGP